jgi:putative oxidoreductase
MNNFFDKLQPFAHASWRIVIGFAFMTHGGQKLFAWFGREEPVAYMSRFGIAGVIEFFGGVFIMLGLFTRPVAFIASGHMAVAYWWMHAGGADPFSIWHWQNRGEMVMIFCFTWLLLAAFGPGDFSIDNKFLDNKATNPAP